MKIYPLWSIKSNNEILQQKTFQFQERSKHGCKNVGYCLIITCLIENGCLYHSDKSEVVFCAALLALQKIEYLAKKKSGKVYHRTQKLTTLAKCERPSIPRGHTDSWSNISFVVPQVLASRLDGCSIINIKHYIEVQLFHSTLRFPACKNFKLSLMCCVCLYYDF